MKIERDTKLADILQEYPALKDELKNINPRFQTVTSPLGKIMLKTVTVADMSKRSGMDEEELINALKTTIENL